MRAVLNNNNNNNNRNNNNKQKDREYLEGEAANLV